MPEMVICCSSTVEYSAFSSHVHYWTMTVSFSLTVHSVVVVVVVHDNYCDSKYRHRLVFVC